MLRLLRAPSAFRSFFAPSSFLARTMSGKTIVHTDKAPAAVGPYSQAVAVNGMLYLSGQIPLDPATGAMVGGDDVAQQTEQVMKNIQAVLESQNLTFDSIVKTTVLITDMDHFGAVNEVYAKYFTSDPPARACFAVKTLPKNALVEIESIAVYPNSAEPPAKRPNAAL